MGPPEDADGQRLRIVDGGARVRRPTYSRISRIDAAARLGRRGGEDGAQRLRGAPLLADHLAEVLLGDLQLEHQGVRLGDLFDLDLLGTVDETARQVVDELAQRGLTRSSERRRS